jgi:hypothetical protein
MSWHAGLSWELLALVSRVNQRRASLRAKLLLVGSELAARLYVPKEICRGGHGG